MKFDEITRELVYRSMEAGTNFKSACALAGISEWCGYNWLNRGRMEPHSEYGEFCRKVDYYKNLRISNAENVIFDAVENKKDARLALEVVERLAPDVWAKKQILQAYVVPYVQQMLEEFRVMMSPSAFEELLDCVAKRHANIMDTVAREATPALPANATSGEQSSPVEKSRDN